MSFTKNFLKVLIKELDVVNSNWTDLARFILDYNDTLATPMWKPVAKEIRDFYFESKEEISEKNLDKLIKLVSDRFLVDIDSSIKLQAKNNKSPVYYYQFGFPSDSSTNKSKSKSPKNLKFFDFVCFKLLLTVKTLSISSTTCFKNNQVPTSSKSKIS